MYRLSPIVPSFSDIGRHWLLATIINVGAQYAVIHSEIAVACPFSDLCLLQRHATNINFFHLSVSLSKLWNLRQSFPIFIIIFCHFCPVLCYYIFFLAFWDGLRHRGLCLLLEECPEYFFSTKDSQCVLNRCRMNIIWKYNSMSVKNHESYFASFFTIANLFTGPRIFR